MITFRVLSGDAAHNLREYLQNTDSVAAAQEYYQHGVEQGVWLGQLAAQWGLKGTAQGEAVEGLFAGIHPTTCAQLAQRRKDDARSGFDFTFSAPKSVSIAAIQDLRVVDAFSRAVEVGFGELERFAARRVRAGTAAWSRDYEITGNLAAARYIHHDSRAGDPNLHAHVAIFNVTQSSSDGKLYALENGEMAAVARKSGYATQAFWNALGWEMRRLGYEVERGEHGQPEIAGIDQSLQDLFSQRSREMDAAMDAELARRQLILKRATGAGIAPESLRSWLHGQNERWADLGARKLSNNEIAVLARSSRRQKDHVDLATRTATWLSQMSPDQRAKLEGVVSLSRQKDLLPIEQNDRTAEAMSYAAAHLFERDSAVPRHELHAAALKYGLGHVDLTALKQHENQNDIVGGFGVGLNQVVTTKDHYELEKYAVSAVDSLAGAYHPISKDYRCSVLREGEAWRDGKLSKAQAKAVEGILQSTDGIIGLRGVAGAGKTTSLRVFDQAARLTGDGYDIIYLAPTTKAVDVLKKEGFENAMTVTRFLVDQKVQESLTSRTVIVCDEAGFLSMQQGAELSRVSAAHRARLIAVGDTAQHSGVEAGDWLRVISKYSRLQTYTLSEIHRQKDPGYLAATKLMVGKSVEEGILQLDKMGWVIETPTPEKDIANHYIAARKAGEDHLAVAPTHAIIESATKDIRRQLISEGLLGRDSTKIIVAKSLNLTEAEKKDPRSYNADQIVTFVKGVKGFAQSRAYRVVRVDAKGNLELRSPGGNNKTVPLQQASKWDVAVPKEIDLRPGDRLQVRTNDKKAKLVNGEILTFKAFDKRGGIRTEQNKTIPRHMLGFDYGYVVTSHKSQGATHDTAAMIGGRDAKALLVSATRARQGLRIYTTDKRQLMASARRSGDRIAALEAVNPQNLVSAKPRSEIADSIYQSVVNASSAVKSAVIKVKNTHEHTKGVDAAHDPRLARVNAVLKSHGLDPLLRLPKTLLDPKELRARVKQDKQAAKIRTKPGRRPPATKHKASITVKSLINNDESKLCVELKKVALIESEMKRLAAGTSQSKPKPKS